MVHLFFPVFCLLTLVSAQYGYDDSGPPTGDDAPPTNTTTTPTGTDQTANNAAAAGKGDSRCTTNMCISAVVTDQTVQYTLSATGKSPVGWMAMGFGTQMINTPMVIMWPNADGTVTLSQRQAGGYSMPTVVNAPPRVATLQSTLSTATGNTPSFVYTIPANADTKQNVIFAFGTQNPGSSDKAATIVQHFDRGTFQLDLSKDLPTGTDGKPTLPNPSQGSDTGGATDDIPFTPYQRMVIAHALFCVVGFAVLLPIGALLARYLRTATPTWFTGHWIAQFGVAGPVIITGFILGFQAAGKLKATLWDDHKRFGVVLVSLYILQCIVGAIIHWVKPKKNTGRPPQNYFHAVFGITIIALGMYQIRSGFNVEWPTYSGRGSVPTAISNLWIAWCVLLPLLYLGGLTLLRKQYRQEDAYRKGYGREEHDMTPRP
ncbi:hypothetical protein C8J57DRAFT_1381237 [Mycena rebaudengoi]|nr:hypothetical protein C8J57DRAFT_1381237 [Mycena rebaudengoi]